MFMYFLTTIPKFIPQKRHKVPQQSPAPMHTIPARSYYNSGNNEIRQYSSTVFLMRINSVVYIRD